MADEKNSKSEEEKKGFFENKIVRNVAIGVGVGAAVGVAAPVAVAAGLAVTGFGAGGVVAGSVAAGIQSSIGSVAAGSLFASKVLSLLLEACFDLISSPKPLVKTQIMGGKITKNLGFESPLRRVLSFFFSFSNSP